MVEHAALPVARSPAVIAITETLDLRRATFIGDFTGHATGHLEVVREPLLRELVGMRERIEDRKQVATLEVRRERAFLDVPMRGAVVIAELQRFARTKPVAEPVGCAERHFATTSVLPAGAVEHIAPDGRLAAAIVRLVPDAMPAADALALIVPVQQHALLPERIVIGRVQSFVGFVVLRVSVGAHAC